jgi:hypothetical protein
LKIQINEKDDTKENIHMLKVKASSKKHEVNISKEGIQCCKATIYTRKRKFQKNKARKTSRSYSWDTKAKV